MRLASWQNYQLMDTSCGEKLERFSNVVLIRPDPQIIWNTDKNTDWKKAHARYMRSNTGGGQWYLTKRVPEQWKISYKSLNFNLKLMGFKHTGIFPEQAVNWDLMTKLIKNSCQKNFRVLNMFAYTGGATLACASAGATVCHVDSSKGMVSWAKENLQLSGIKKDAVRFIVDDCKKFVKREVRRQKKYEGIIMDPPSYGRGPCKEIWKLENNLFALLQETEKLLSDKAKFLILNSYTTGLPPGVMRCLLELTVKSKRGGKVSADEIGLKVVNQNIELPCGTTAIWTPDGVFF